ncbi:NAD-binding protein [Atractiella rhizophila]|nr:NAD-binding protein [Atractiella rhizophila]
MSVFNTSRLQGKTVLVTGASGGIGAETAILFGKAGSNVVLTARRLEELKKVAAKIEGVKTLCLEHDVSDKASTDALPKKIEEAGLGPVDILVNNAGLVFGVEKVGEVTDSDVETMFNINVLGLIHITQLFVNQFKARNSGHIIQLGSIAGREAYAGGSIYCATKHAVRAFTTSLLKELVSYNVRVSEVQPGMVETNFSVTRFRGDKQKADNVYSGLEPLTPVDIAEEIVWVASRPERVNIAEVLVFPSAQASAQVVHRNT